MSTSTHEPVAAVAKVVKCQGCGVIFRNVPWRAGDRCPRCRSAAYAPVEVAGNAVEYLLADRSQGYALEDIRFAKIALWSQLISAQQYQEAFNRQKEFVGAGGTVPPIGDIMRDAGMLKKIQVQAVLDYRCRERPDVDDGEFAKLAIQSGFVVQDKLAECMDAQRNLQRLGHDVPPLPCLLYEKRHLQENQVLALLAKQQERGSGMIPAVQKHIEEHRPRRLDAVLGPKGSTKRKLRIPVFGTLILCLLVVVVKKTVAAPAPIVTTQCTNPSCSQRGAMPANVEWPATCDVCKTPKSVFPVSICTQCGTEFVNEKLEFLHPRCPKCGSAAVAAWITKETDVKAIKEAAKKNKKP